MWTVTDRAKERGAGFGFSLPCGVVLGVLSCLVPPSIGADSAPIGQPFVVTSDTLHDLEDPVVAYNTQREEYLVAWEGIPGVFTLTQLTKNGEPVWPATSPVITVVGEKPAIAYSEATDEYLVVYQWHDGTDYDLYGIRLEGGSPTAVGTIGFDISTRVGDQTNPAVAYNRHSSYQDFFVVWEDLDTSWVPAHEDIWGQRVAGTSGGGDAGGELFGGNLAVAFTDVSTEPDVAYNLNMNEYLVVFTRQTASGLPKDVWARRVTRDGVLLTETVIDSSEGDQVEPVVAAYRLDFTSPYLVVFQDFWNDVSGDIRGYLVTQLGEPSQLVNIATQNGAVESSPAIFSDEELGGYMVTWVQMGSDWDVFATRVQHDGLVENPSNISVYGPTAVPCNERAPAVAGGPTGLAVWQDSCLGGGGPLRIAGRFVAGLLLFTDDFESGDVSAWSAASP